MYLVLMINPIYKYVVQPWAPEWRHSTLIFFMAEVEEIFLSGYP